jgi:hypothetical protein
MLDMNELGYLLYMDKMQHKEKEKQQQEVNVKIKNDLADDQTRKKEN